MMRRNRRPSRGDIARGRALKRWQQDQQIPAGSPDLQRALDAVGEFGIHPAAFDLDTYLAGLEARHG